MNKTIKSWYILGALLVSTMSANAITKTWSGSSLNHIDKTTGAVALTGNHINLSVTPMTDGEEFTYENNNLHTGKWTTGNRSYTIQWGCNQGATLKVTELSVSMCTYGTWLFNQDKFGYAKLGANDSVEVTTNFATFTNVSDTISADLMAQMVMMELSRVGNFSSSNPFIIESITLEYTLVPDAPVLGDTKEISVDVTTDEANPNYVDLADIFSTNDHYGEYLAYDCIEENATFEDGKFYATAAGTYHVKAYVAALKNCHDQSEMSEEEFTITVNRVDPILDVLKADTTIQVTSSLEDIHAVDMLDMLDYEGDGLVFEVIEGDANNVVIADSMVYATKIGNYTIQVSSPESPRYNAASPVTLTFHVISGVPTALTDVKNENKVVKEIRNGQLMIHHDGKCYNVSGTIIR